MWLSISHIIHQNNETSDLLLEEVTSDIFSIKLGQMNPYSEATIRITYVTELQAENKSTRVTIPTTVTPRFIPDSDQSKDATSASINFSAITPAPVSLQGPKLSTFLPTLLDLTLMFNLRQSLQQQISTPMIHFEWYLYVLRFVFTIESYVWVKFDHWCA